MERERVGRLGLWGGVGVDERALSTAPPGFSGNGGQGREGVGGLDLRFPVVGLDGLVLLDFSQVASLNLVIKAFGVRQSPAFL